MFFKKFENIYSFWDILERISVNLIDIFLPSTLFISF